MGFQPSNGTGNMVTMHMRLHVICSLDARVSKVIRIVLSSWLLLKQRAPRKIPSIAFFGRWICAGFLAASLVCPAHASDFWLPFNREPQDPVEKGKIDAANDPAEAINRQIYQGNKFVDDLVIKPVTRGYVEQVPEGVRDGIRNFTNNLGEPIVFINDILQGNIKRAWNTTQRFAVNTAVGGIGFVDVATTLGRPHHDADLGQTFGVWGIEPGPAVQIPLLGPSNLRDAFGLAATSSVVPLAAHGAVETVISYTQLGSDSANTLDYRARLLPNTDALEKASKDYYASTRLIKAQLRAKLVEEGKVGHVSREEANDAEAPPK
jgi:phospholipid-binding lipoprotein MlaA